MKLEARLDQVALVLLVRHFRHGVVRSKLSSKAVVLPFRLELGGDGGFRAHLLSTTVHSQARWNRCSRLVREARHFLHQGDENVLDQVLRIDLRQTEAARPVIEQRRVQFDKTRPCLGFAGVVQTFQQADWSGMHECAAASERNYG